MKRPIKSFLFTAIYVLMTPFLLYNFCYADEITRTDIINDELDCWSNVSRAGTGQDAMIWNETCITNPSAQGQDSRNAIIDQTLEGFPPESDDLSDTGSIEPQSGKKLRSISVKVDDNGKTTFYTEPDTKYDASTQPMNPITEKTEIRSKSRAENNNADEILKEDTLDKLDAVIDQDFVAETGPKTEQEPLIQDRDTLENRDLIEKFKKRTPYSPSAEEKIPIQHRDVLEDRDLIDKYNKIREPSPENAGDLELERKDVLEDRDLIEQYDNIELNKATAFEILHLGREDPLGSFEMGTEAYSYQYREPDLMKDTGYLYGIYGILSFRSHLNKEAMTLKEIFDDFHFFNYIKFDLRAALGDVDYESNGTGSLNDMAYYTFEGRGLFGYDLPLWDSTCLTPYLGFGWRYLYDDGGGQQTSTGHWSYDRESRYFYLPVGLEIFSEWEKGWEMRLTVEYDYLVDGRQTSHLDDVGRTVRSSEDEELYTLDPLKNKQKDGFGLRGSFKLVKKNTAFDFVLEPFIRYWNLEDSDTKQLSSEGGGIIWYYDAEHEHQVLGYEPKNTTTEYGVRLGIRY